MTNVVSFPAAPKRTARTDAAAYADDLSFMRKLSRSERKGKLYGIDFWDVTATGEQSDWRRGKELAREFLAYVIANPTYGNFTLFNCIVSDMHRKAAEEGRKLNFVELGFLKSIGLHAVAAAAADLSDRIFE